MTSISATPYYRLDPDTVIHAVESLGLLCDGRMFPLNSYENRVYQIGIEEEQPLIAKFYRPQRWTDEQIKEEHQFSLELAEAELPVVAPLLFDGESLHHHDGFRFALFPRRGGHAPELDDKETRLWLGRFMGRIHSIGRHQPFQHRPELSIHRFVDESVEYIYQERWVPAHLESAFESLIPDLKSGIEDAYQRAGQFQVIRLHGDCHPGNILWRDGPLFVDFDDCQSGPAIQDLWMLLSGDATTMSAQLDDVMEGYQQFCTFNPVELNLVEALRSMRMIHHAAWLARRWEDPAFPIAFPWFDSVRYWEDLTLSLREQLARLYEPPLALSYY